MGWWVAALPPPAPPQSRGSRAAGVPAGSAIRALGWPAALQGTAGDRCLGGRASAAGFRVPRCVRGQLASAGPARDGVPRDVSPVAGCTSRPQSLVLVE